MVDPPPDLSPLIAAQADAARFYVLLTITLVGCGLASMASPTILPLSQDEIKTAMRIGGALVAALGAFPSAKYLQRKDKKSALEMISKRYEQLRGREYFHSPARSDLDKMVVVLIKGMLKG